MTTIDAATAYSGDAILIRWSEGPKGRTVTFELDEEGAQHPFKGLKFGSENGQRFHLAAVCKAPDETAQDLRDAKCGPDASKPGGSSLATGLEASPPHASAAQGQGKPRTPFRELPRSQQAALKCNDGDFQIWLAMHYKDEWDDLYRLNTDSKITANAALYSIIGLASKRELDTDPEAGKRWDRLLTDYDMRDMRK